MNLFAKLAFRPLWYGKTGAFCTVFTTATATVLLAYGGFGVSRFSGFAVVLISIAMITSALTAGVSGRRRQIALLRCSGMTRGGVAKLVLREALAFAANGWVLGIFAVGVGLGFPSAETVLLTAFAVCASAAIAAVIPVINACRVRPLDATGSRGVSGREISIEKTAAGAVFLVFVLLTVFGAIPVFSPNPIYVLFLFAAGVLLCLHPFTRLAESAFARLAEYATGLDCRVFSRRLSRAPERVAGTMFALSVGFAAYMTAPADFMLWTLSVTSVGAAILLASSAYSSAHEINAMRASGMTRQQISVLFAGEAFLTVLCALAIGLAGWLLLGRFFEPEVFGAPGIRVLSGIAAVSLPPLLAALAAIPAFVSAKTGD